MTIEDSGLQQINQALIISPNPVKIGGIIYISGIQQASSFQLISLDGKAVQKGNTEGEIQLTNRLLKGNYLLKINDRTYPITLIE